MQEVQILSFKVDPLWTRTTFLTKLPLLQKYPFPKEAARPHLDSVATRIKSEISQDVRHIVITHWTPTSFDYQAHHLNFMAVQYMVMIHSNLVRPKSWFALWGWNAQWEKFTWAHRIYVHFYLWGETLDGNALRRLTVWHWWLPVVSCKKKGECTISVMKINQTEFIGQSSVIFSFKGHNFYDFLSAFRPLLQKGWGSKNLLPCEKILSFKVCLNC